MKMWLKYLLFAAISFNSYAISEDLSIRKIDKNRMCQDLDIIRHMLDVSYAPFNWKKNSFQWDLEEALRVSKEKIILSEKITTRQFHQIVNQFLNTTRGHHVGVVFISTEASTLPFSVRGVEGHYYVDWIDPDSPYIHPLIKLGDEIISFNDQPIQEIIDDYRIKLEFQSNPQTDQSLSEMYLTHRSGKKGDDIPTGAVTIVLKSAADDVLRTCQLIWDYNNELISDHANEQSAELRPAHIFLPKSFSTAKNKKLSMLNPLLELHLHPRKASSSDFNKSFLPELGDILSDESVKPFYAYIYKNEEGRLIGYIRIDTYSGDTKATKTFGKIIKKFKEKTDALVIDQLNNPGGGLLYLYSILSCLTDHSFITPKHCLSITQEDVLNAHRVLWDLRHIDTDQDFKKFISEGDFNKQLYGPFFFKNFNYVLFLRAYNQFIISEWNKGKSFTSPTHVDGVDHINPHPKYRYTKPICVLMNELGFSASDFFSAILQDNKRATLFGTRTAGAGGYVAAQSFPNLNGIDRVFYTASLALRPNGDPIEDLGVIPDIEYQITKEDLQNEYKFYIQAVNEAINGLLK